jgi:hypothetical protein
VAALSGVERLQTLYGGEEHHRISASWWRRAPALHGTEEFQSWTNIEAEWTLGATVEKKKEVTIK